MSYEQEIQQTRDLLDNYNQLDDATRGKLANGVEWLAFLQNLSKGNGDTDNTAQNSQPAV